MIKIGICDDEKSVVSQIERELSEISLLNYISIEMDGFYYGEDLVKEVRNGVNYDLIFLDIQMKGNNGIITAKKIREYDENVLLVYVSSYEKYAIELFRLDVFEFIKKPIMYEKIKEIFLAAVEKICKQKKYFVYSYKKMNYKIICNEILYFESKGRKIYIHTKNQIEIFNEKLDSIENRLRDGKNSFIRIHQSFLVNFALIEKYCKTTVTLVNKRILPISADKQKQFEFEYVKFLGGDSI